MGGIIEALSTEYRGAAHAETVPTRLLTSWERSAACNVNLSSYEIAFDDGFNADSHLAQVAYPVVGSLVSSLSASPFSGFLFDAEGRIVRAWHSNADARHQLRGFAAEPGFVFSEESAGTNGCGTVLEDRAPIMLGRFSHYRRPAVDLVCAGAPIIHPLTQRLLGAISLTCRHDVASALMLPMITHTAEEISDALLGHATSVDREVLELVRKRSVGHSRPVLGLTETTLISNQAGYHLIADCDRYWLWDALARHRGPAPVRGLVSLRDGSESIPVVYSSITRGRTVVGVIIELSREGDRPAARAVPALGVAPSEPATAKDTATGVQLLGTSLATTVLQTELDAALRLGSPILITGEAGTGKLESARAVLRAEGVDEPVVHDCRTAPLACVLELIASGEAGIVTHLEALDGQAGREVAELLDRRPTGATLVATLTHDGAAVERDAVRELTYTFGNGRVEMLPVRQRRDDLATFVTHFLDRDNDRRTWVKSETMQVFSRYRWPGNWTEVRSVLAAMVEDGGAGRALEPGSAPVHVRTAAAPRELTLLEQAEADAVATALRLADGNKLKAAELLGISRSRLYRKVRTYGLDIA